MTNTNLIEIFCILDEFCKYLSPELKKHQISVPGKVCRNRPSLMSDSEIMLILKLFHTYRFRDLKSFYLGYVCIHMKNSLMNLRDKIMLRKRALIETVNDELKNVCHIEHTRHRSIDSFATNLLAGLIAYNLLPKKPSMNIEIIDKSRRIV